MDRKKKLHSLLVIIPLVILGIFAWRYMPFHSKKKVESKSAIYVAVDQVKRGDLPIYLSALGTVTSSETVTVKTQINGQLLRILFQEGQDVKAGDLLAEIDSRPYEAQLLEYQGLLLRDEAMLANARLDLERYKVLSRQDAVSKQTYDTQVWLVKQLEGTVKSDQGLIETAKVNINYCHIAAPINGRVGLRQVDPGNYVQVTDPNGIVVLNTVDPIEVVFSIAEDKLPLLMEQMNRSRVFIVEAYDRWQHNKLATGRLLTIDNQIDTSTGTLKLKAEFGNKDSKLFPNQFVNVELLVKTLKDVLMVPTAAIQHGAKGTFLFVLGDKNMVHTKSVSVVGTYQGFSAITGDIRLNQFVVTEGTDKLTDESSVLVSHPQ